MIKKPSDESIVGYFYGLTRNSFVFYTSHQIGMDTAPAMDKYLKLTFRLTKYLAEQLHDLDLIDIEEITWEIDYSVSLEKVTYDFWKSCKDVFTNPDMGFEPFADRIYPVRPFSEETAMSYFFGLSFLVKNDTPNREDKIYDFAKQIRKTIAPNITNERILELRNYYMNDEKIIEMRYKAVEILDIRYALTGKLPGEKH